MESRAAWNYLKPAHGETVCDLGCGGGANDVLLSLRGAKVFGVDIDRGSLFQAKRQASSLGVEANYAVAELGQSQFLCFKSASFDKAVSYCVLEHLGYPEGLLEEVHRILRPGGTFILSVDSFSYRDVPRRFVELHRRFCSVRRYYTLREAEVLLRDGNFHIRASTFLVKSALASYFFRILLSYYFDSIAAGESLRLRCFKLLTPIWLAVSAVSDLFWGHEQGGYLLVLHAAKEAPARVTLTAGPKASGNAPGVKT
jgi:SAM-dependent methyltransferase